MATRNQQDKPAEPEAPRQDAAVAGAATDLEEARRQVAEAQQRAAVAEAELAAARSDAETRAAEQARTTGDEAPPAPRLDETVPGGRFLHNSILVNANGEPLAE